MCSSGQAWGQLPSQQPRFEGLPPRHWLTGVLIFLTAWHRTMREREMGTALLFHWTSAYRPPGWFEHPVLKSVGQFKGKLSFPTCLMSCFAHTYKLIQQKCIVKIYKCCTLKPIGWTLLHGSLCNANVLPHNPLSGVFSEAMCRPRLPAQHLWTWHCVQLAPAPPPGCGLATQRTPSERLNHNAKMPGSSAFVVLELLNSSHRQDRVRNGRVSHSVAHYNSTHANAMVL